MKQTNQHLLLVSLLAGTCAACAHTERPLPNIVFVIADDVSWNDFGCYGNTDVRTPHIDRLAAEGLRFNNMYLTASSCSPSRTSIISGRYPHNTGSCELHTALPDHLTIFPEELRKAGYYTAASGKWHMGQAAERGFDTLAIKEIGLSGSESWLNVLRDRDPDKPFFLWLASLDAHRSWSADSCANPHDPEGLRVPAGLADMPATRSDLASYYNEIQRFDRYVGMVREELERQGVAENTLIVVTADNGRPFPRAKTRVYDSGMRTPFIVWWPEGVAQPGSATDALVSIIDMAPTLTSLAGLPPAPSYQGKSFSSLFYAPVSEFRKYVFSEHNWHDYEAYERMVRTKDFLFLYNGRPELANQGPADVVTSPSMTDLRTLRDQGALNEAQQDLFLTPRPIVELYNCRVDPDHLNNLADEEEYAIVSEELRRVLAAWQIATADTEPEVLTADWYLRESDEYVNTQNHGIRGEMPGARLRADLVDEGGAF